MTLRVSQYHRDPADVQLKLCVAHVRSKAGVVAVAHLRSCYRTAEAEHFLVNSLVVFDWRALQRYLGGLREGVHV